MTINIITKVVSHFEQNCRIIIDESSNEAIIIDPGAEEDTLFSLCSPYSVKMIFLTHCHLDHAGAVTPLINLFQTNNLPTPKLIYHSNEIIIGQHIEILAQQYGLPQNTYTNPPKPDIEANNIPHILIGESKLKLLFTPGHSPGHIALYFGEKDFKLDKQTQDNYSGVLIAGDTLFYNSIGRTDLPMSNHEDLIQSINNQLFTLPDNTLVCPGHGPNTSIKHEKMSNPFLE